MQSCDKALGQLGWLNLETRSRNYRLMLAHWILKKEAENKECYTRDKFFNRLLIPRANWVNV